MIECKICKKKCKGRIDLEGIKKQENCCLCESKEKEKYENQNIKVLIINCIICDSRFALERVVRGKNYLHSLFYYDIGDSLEDLNKAVSALERMEKRIRKEIVKLEL